MSQKITVELEQRIVDTYLSGLSVRTTSKRLNLSTTAVRGVLRRQCIHVRNYDCQRRAIDPTPEQIQNRARIIRATWGTLDADAV